MIARTSRWSSLAWLAVVVTTSLAWLVMVLRPRGMPMGMDTGTMGLSLTLFVALWVAMMAAMMLPSVAPAGMLWTRTVASAAGGWQRSSRLTAFVSGYLVAWAGYGLLAFAVLVGVDRLLRAGSSRGTWIAAGLFALAGAYQLTPLKDACLRQCRSPLGLFFRYASFRGRAVDLRVGVHHGLYCVGCCWGLMVALVAVGMMNLAAMAGLAAVVALEKLWRGGPALARASGVAFLALAALVPFHPGLAPGLAM